MKGSLARACQRWRCHGNSFYCYQSSTVWQVNRLIFYVSNDSLPGPDVYSSGITSEEQKIVSVSAVTGRLPVFKGALLRYRLVFTTKTWYFLPTAILHPFPVHFVSSPKIPRHFRGFSGNRNWQLVFGHQLTAAVMGLRLDSVPAHLQFPVPCCLPAGSEILPGKTKGRPVIQSGWLPGTTSVCFYFTNYRLNEWEKKTPCLVPRCSSLPLLSPSKKTIQSALQSRRQRQRPCEDSHNSLLFFVHWYFVRKFTLKIPK